MEHELYHYGILGMKWGIRRYQNKDGSLTEAGKKHYGVGTDIGSRGRKNRAKDAAEIEARIRKIASKKPTEKNVTEIEHLSKMWQGLAKDLHDAEIDYGRSYVNNKIEKKDTKWAERNYQKIEKKLYNASKHELYDYKRKELDPVFGKNYNRSFFNAWNKKMAEVMTKNAADIKAPSGRSVKFVAKRAEYGVMMAIADEGSDMSQFKNGVWSSGRLAYRKKTVNVSEIKR